VSWEPGATDVARGCADAAGSQIGGARGRHPRGLRSEGPHRRVRPRAAGVRWLTPGNEPGVRRGTVAVRVRVASPVTTAISVSLALSTVSSPPRVSAAGPHRGRRQQREATARSSRTPTLRGFGVGRPGHVGDEQHRQQAPGPTVITSISGPVISTEPPQPASRASQARATWAPPMITDAATNCRGRPRSLVRPTQVHTLPRTNGAQSRPCRCDRMRYQACFWARG
jgi:hypothetical protein